MSREMPKVPTMRPCGSRSGILVVDTQVTLAVEPGFLLLHVDDRLAGGDHLLLVAEGLLGVLAR